MKFVKSFIVTLALLASTAASAHDNILEAAARREIMHATMGVQNPYRATCLEVQKEGVKAYIQHYPGMDVKDEVKITLMAQYHDATQMITAIQEMLTAKKIDKTHFSWSSILQAEKDMPTYAKVLAASGKDIGNLSGQIKAAAVEAYSSVFTLNLK